MTQTLEKVDPSYLYSMFKGEPGTRKSTAALSYPGPQYWFSFDRKMNALLLPMRAWGIDPSTVEFDNYGDWDKARIKLESFLTVCPYKTIIIDSITSLADTALRQFMKFKGSGVKKVAGIPVSGIEDFNAESSVLSELAALTKDIYEYQKINVILIAHVIQVDQKNIDGSTHVSRSIVTAGKKIAAKIPAYCDEVYHFNINKGFVEGAGGKYALLTEHNGDDFARTTLPLAKEIEFGGDSLYEKWIKPAQEVLMKDPVTITKF